MDQKTDAAFAATSASLSGVRQSVRSDLQYVSLQVEGKTYGGWYRMLADGQLELLALADMRSDMRSDWRTESTPIEQARGMLAEFVSAARSKSRTSGTGAGSIPTTSKVSLDEERDDSATTLGDLLYADRAKARASEAEWVNLVQSIAAGDSQALHGLFERAHRMVFTLVMRLTHSLATAEQLTVDTFHSIWLRARGYDAAGGSVVGWIMNQARSRALDHVRFEARKQERRPAEGFGAAADGIQEGSLFREALMGLTPDERLMIESVFFSELGYANLAVELQQAPGTVRARIHSGLGKLKQALPGGVKAEDV